MPIYEFRCQECEKVSEFQLKLADPHPQDCPLCGRPALKKIMSLPSFQLKGGGWYAEAYDGKSNKRDAPPAEAGKPAAPAGESKPAPAAASDSKAAAAAPAPAPAAAKAKD